MTENEAPDQAPRAAGSETWPIALEPGQRPTLYTAAQLRFARRQTADGLDRYDMLMRRPDEMPEGADPGPEWQRVPAAKYLKFRAREWREAASAADLPAAARADAEAIDAAFGTGPAVPEAS